jgi:hypothetical protein
MTLLEQVRDVAVVSVVFMGAAAIVGTAIHDHFAVDPRKRLAEFVAELWSGARIALATAVCTSVAAIILLICIACPLLLIVVPIPALLLIGFIAFRMMGDAA